MKKTLILGATAALLLSGCSKEQLPGGGSTSADSGRVEFVCSSEAQVENLTRATVELPSECVPKPSQFNIAVNVNGEVQRYTAGKEYSLVQGDYRAVASYGNATEEGPKAYFTGAADFTVEAETDKQVTIEAKLANSAITLTTGEWFNKYYKSATLTVTTSAGNSFDFTMGSSKLIFVQAGTTLKLKGTAVKAQNDATVEFPEKEIGTTKACTKHTIIVKAAQVGQGNLTIELDDTLTSVTAKEYELNPEA